MDKYEFAKMLGIRQIGKELTADEELLAKESGLVVIFGASDDLIEVRGAIDDEFSCYDGGYALFHKHKPYHAECEADECPHEDAIRGSCTKVRALWADPESTWCWSYKTDVPFSTFNVLEDDEPYCLGIVVSLEDLK